MNDADERQLERHVAELYRAPVSVEIRARERLLQAIRAARPPRRARFGLDWLVRPSTIGVSPLAGVAAGLILLGVGVTLGAGWRWQGRAQALRPPAAAAPATAHAVEFVLVAPEAGRVALVGDFNGWDPQAAPMRRVRGSNAWAVAVSVPEGRHVYAFVVDGREWVADPTAPLAPGDGFGMRSSVVVVGDSESS